MGLHMLVDEPGGAGRGEAVMLCGHTESDPFAKVNPYTNHIKTWLHSDDRCIACVQEMHRRLPLSAEDMSVAVATRDPMTAVTHLPADDGNMLCGDVVRHYDRAKPLRMLKEWCNEPSACEACRTALRKLVEA